MVSACPANQPPIRLDVEFRAVEESRWRSGAQDQFDLPRHTAATVDDLRRFLLKYKPEIVHFSGHGDRDALCFNDEQGQTHEARAEPLGRLFGACNEYVKCVVLNSCYSEAQARVIQSQVDYTIGMSKEIGDEAAIKFSVGFYDAIWAGQNYEKAYDFGTNSIDLHNLPDYLVPKLFRGTQLGGSEIQYSDTVREVEGLIKQYIRTPSRNRYSYCVRGDQIRPDMEQHYGGKNGCRVDDVKVMTFDSISSDRHHVTALLSLGGKSEQWKCVVCGGPDGNLIDWYATTGYNPMPLKTYKATMPPGPNVFRLVGEFDSFYLDCFRDMHQHMYSIDLYDKDSGEHINGYIAKGCPDGKEIYELMKDGRKHAITVELRYPKDGGSGVALISKLIRPNWFTE
jgi:hypothetical protein